MVIQLQLRNDTAANWTSSNPVLAMGEKGYETDTKKWKTGDGTTAWNSLDYEMTEIPIATDSVIGGIKIGDGLNIDPVTGVCSASVGGIVEGDQGKVLTAGDPEDDPTFLYVGVRDTPNMRSHSISNGSGGTLTNYQIMFNVYRKSGVDSGNNVYLGYGVKADFSDLRFYDDTNDVRLDYWIESIIDGCATVWVEFPSISTSGLTMQIIFGNASATSQSDGSTVFPFFDDFPGTSLNAQWTALGTQGSYSIEDSILEILIAGLATRGFLANTGDINDATVITCTKMRDMGKTYTGDHQIAGIGIKSSGLTVGVLSALMCNAWWADTKMYDLASSTQSPYGTSSGGVDLSEWSFLEIRHDYSANTYARQRGGSWKSWAMNPAGTHVFFGLKSLNGSVLASIQVDWVFQRKYAATEPTHGEWGLISEITTAINTAVYS